MDHLENALSEYQPKQDIIARVITVDFEKKRIGLSELPHIVNLTLFCPNTKVGDILCKVKVTENIYGNSYLVEGESENTSETIKCFMHKMHVSIEVKASKNKNKRVRAENKGMIQLKVGEKLHCKARIKEFNYFDGIPIVQPLIETDGKPLVTWETVSGGMTVEGIIKDIVDEEYVNISINEFVSGRLYREHITDVPQKRISKKIKSSIGQKITLKVWKVVQHKRILELTGKESLIKEKQFVPTEYEDPRVSTGIEITGVLQKEHAQGYILEFYNGIRGYLPFRILEKYNKKFSYTKGSMIQCYMLYKSEKGLDLTISKEESLNYKPKTEFNKSKNGG